MATVTNVSAGKPDVSGAVNVAAYGTTLPTSASATLDDDFVNLGYISDAGLTNSNSREMSEVKAWGGDTVLSVQTDKKDTFKFTLIETLNPDVLAAVFATDTFQSKVATAIGEIVELFEDEACTPVAFVNPADAFEYLGTTSITVQSNFGISYIENFLGIATIIMDSNITAGTVYATAAENLNLIAAACDAIPGMSMTTDETGIIAVYNGALYENGAIQTVCYSGINAFPSFLDRIVACTYSA